MNLFTIGHSNHSQEDFLNLLQTHNVNCVVDVRSIPASNHNPQFNQDALQAFLSHNGIDYQFFGHEFGARRTDSINSKGQVDFEIAVTTTLFQQGIERMSKLLNTKNITLMCSEANPLDCHRFALVARYFHLHGVNVCHILGDGSSVSHQSLEQQMINHYLQSRKPVLPEIDELFGTYTKGNQLNDAYRLKNKEIGFKFDLNKNFFDRIHG